MSFTQQYVVGVNPPVRTLGGLLISWSGTLPAGQVWQVYLGPDLAWHGTQARCHVPAPDAAVRITIGSVDVADAATSFAAAIPPSPETRAELAWTGGRFEDPGGDVKGFRVYGEPTPGGGIDRSAPLADIPLFIGRVATDGWNMGGWDVGGWGYAGGSYSWTSDPLTSGTWAFAVVPYDAAGNEGAAQTASVAIDAPPRPPAPFADATRLHYILLGWSQVPWGSGGWGLPEAQLQWNPSPG